MGACYLKGDGREQDSLLSLLRPGCEVFVPAPAPYHHGLPRPKAKKQWDQLPVDASL